MRVELIISGLVVDSVDIGTELNIEKRKIKATEASRYLKDKHKVTERMGQWCVVLVITSRLGKDKNYSYR